MFNGLLILISVHIQRFRNQQHLHRFNFFNCQSDSTRSSSPETTIRPKPMTRERMKLHGMRNGDGQLVVIRAGVSTSRAVSSLLQLLQVATLLRCCVPKERHEKEHFTKQVLVQDFESCLFCKHCPRPLVPDILEVCFSFFKARARFYSFAFRPHLTGYASKFSSSGFQTVEV